MTSQGHTTQMWGVTFMICVSDSKVSFDDNMMPHYKEMLVDTLLIQLPISPADPLFFL